MSQIILSILPSTYVFLSVYLPPSWPLRVSSSGWALGLLQLADTFSPLAQSLVFVVLHFPGTSCYLSLFLGLFYSAQMA